MHSYIRIDVSFRGKTSRYQAKSAFFETFSKCCKSRAPVPKWLAEPTKTETFTIPRVLMVRMSRKEAIFYGLSTEEDIVDAIPVGDEDNIEGEVSEETVTEI